MNNIFKYGAKLYGKLALANIMCFIIVISLTFLSTFIFTSEVGYKVGASDPSGQLVEDLYIHYYADGEDTQYAQYEKEGYLLSKTGIRSEIQDGALLFLQITTQIIGIGILLSFIYPMFWDIGVKDSNAVKFGRIKEDKLKGFKAGLISIIPVTAALILIIFTKETALKDMTITLFKFINSSFYGIIDFVTNHVSLYRDVTVVSLVIILAVQLIIPIFAQLGYMLGFKDISIKERILYKEKI